MTKIKIKSCSYKDCTSKSIDNEKVFIFNVPTKKIVLTSPQLSIKNAKKSTRLIRSLVKLKCYVKPIFKKKESAKRELSKKVYAEKPGIISNVIENLIETADKGEIVIENPEFSLPVG